MIQARIDNWGEAPIVVSADPPAPGPGQASLKMLASSVNPVDIVIASKRFYLTGVNPPYVPGAEIVGEVISSARHAPGTRVWGLCTSGGFAEQAVVPDDRLVPVPNGVSDEQAVAMGIAGLAGWMAVRHRADLNLTDEVLVLGASGMAGQVAVTAARLAGNRVIAAGRNAKALAGLGASATVDLTAPDLKAEIAGVAPEGIDVVIDMVWGEAALAALLAMRRGGRLVQVGNASGPMLNLPAGPLRAASADVRGFSLYSEAWDEVASAYQELCRAAARGDVALPTETVKLKDVAAAWERQVAFTTGAKLVIVAD